jgi:hypothetical protein
MSGPTGICPNSLSYGQDKVTSQFLNPTICSTSRTSFNNRRYPGYFDILNASNTGPYFGYNTIRNSNQAIPLRLRSGAQNRISLGRQN